MAVPVPRRAQGGRRHLRRSGGKGLRRPARPGGVLVFLVLPSIVGAGWLHTELKESDPAGDAVLKESPSAITLTYTTDVQLTLSTVVVRPAASLAAPVPAGELAYLADDRHDVIVLPLSRPLARGGYAVAWTTAGPDGHRLSGDFGFRVEPVAGRTPEEAPGAAVAAGDSLSLEGDAGTGGNGQADAADSGFRFAFRHAVVRLALYGGILALLGAVVFRVVVLGWFGRAGGSKKVVDSAAHRASLVGALGLALLLAVLPAGLLNRAADFFPDDVPGNLFTVAAGTPWAVGWWLQLGLVLLAGTGLFLARSESTGMWGWRLVAASALLVPVAPVLSGHGWADSPRALSTVATYLHVVAAGGWIGGLSCLLFAGLPALREHRSAMGETRPGLAVMVRAFSRVAQIAVALLLVTGAVKVWIHVGAVSDLWTTAWGRSLLVKDGVVAAVLALGFYNWRFVRPALDASSHQGPIRGPAMVELLLGVVAVAVTAYLVAQPLS